MKQWEYKTIKMQFEGFRKDRLDIEELDYELNKLGQEGWELVSLFTNQVNGFTQSAIGVLKRMRNNNV